MFTATDPIIHVGDPCYSLSYNVNGEVVTYHEFDSEHATGKACLLFDQASHGCGLDHPTVCIKVPEFPGAKQDTDRFAVICDPKLDGLDKEHYTEDAGYTWEQVSWWQVAENLIESLRGELVHLWIPQFLEDAFGPDHGLEYTVAENSDSWIQVGGLPSFKRMTTEEKVGWLRFQSFVKAWIRAWHNPEWIRFAWENNPDLEKRPAPIINHSEGSEIQPWELLVSPYHEGEE